MMSGPIITWLGRLSAAVSSRQSAVRMTQEKSCAVLRMPDRPVRNRVFCILRAMLSKRLDSTAIRTPSLTAGPRLASVAMSFIRASAPLLPAGHGSFRPLCSSGRPSWVALPGWAARPYDRIVNRCAGVAHGGGSPGGGVASRALGPLPGRRGDPPRARARRHRPAPDRARPGAVPRLDPGDRRARRLAHDPLDARRAGVRGLARLRAGGDRRRAAADRLAGGDGLAARPRARDLL